MDRRQLLLGAVGVALTISSVPTMAKSNAYIGYTREIYEQALINGEPFLLDFYASW